MKCFICLFGDEVRLYYFIVLHPACSASRCWHVMTVLAKQRSPLALCCLRSRLPSPPSGLLRGRKPGWSQIIIQYSRNNSMIFPIPGGKKIGSHYLPRYTRYRVIAGRVIKGGHCTLKIQCWDKHEKPKSIIHCLYGKIEVGLTPNCWFWTSTIRIL